MEEDDAVVRSISLCMFFITEKNYEAYEFFGAHPQIRQR